mmetsp:Transcript_112086/g.280824  ORF Transcript_112086/g.280824 Transcript_112086/m.280824 type:complete len:409 (-) Transcript_112086:280-1506(-)
MSFTMHRRWNCDQWLYLVSASTKFRAISSPGPATAAPAADPSPRGMPKSPPPLAFSHCSPPPPHAYSTNAKAPGADFALNFSSALDCPDIGTLVALPSPKGTVPSKGSSGNSHSAPGAAWQPMWRKSCACSGKGSEVSTNTVSASANVTTCHATLPIPPSRSVTPCVTFGLSAFFLPFAVAPLAFPFVAPFVEAVAAIAALRAGHSFGRSATRTAPRVPKEAPAPGDRGVRATGVGGACAANSSKSSTKSLPPGAFSQCCCPLACTTTTKTIFFGVMSFGKPITQSNLHSILDATGSTLREPSGCAAGAVHAPVSSRHAQCSSQPTWSPRCKLRLMPRKPILTSVRTPAMTLTWAEASPRPSKESCMVLQRATWVDASTLSPLSLSLSLSLHICTLCRSRGCASWLKV